MFSQELQLNSRMSRVTSYAQLRLAKICYLIPTQLDFQILVRKFLLFATVLSLAIFLLYYLLLALVMSKHGVTESEQYIRKLNFGMSRWHCSRSPLGGWLAMTIVDRYFRHYFPFFCSFILSLSRSFLIEGVLGSKYLFNKIWSEGPTIHKCVCTSSKCAHSQ